MSGTKREPARSLCPAQRQAAEQAGRSSRPVSGMLRGIKEGRAPVSDTWWQVARHIVHRSKRHGLGGRCVHRRNRGQNRPFQRPQGTTVDARNAGRGRRII